MKFHAYRRKGERYTLTSLFGVDYEFLPDAQGRLVCDITDDAAIERLLEITEAFAAVEEDEKPRHALIRDGEEVVLTDMDRAALIDFAEKYGVKVHHKAKDETIREKIVEALTAG